jgi:hypothetical protein
VLRFERQAAGVLADAIDSRQRAAVERWVDASLRDMPRHLRAGVAVISLGLGTWTRVTRRAPGDVVTATARSPIPAVRQYQRLLRSLVVFAAMETQGRRTP